jgi:uncharacterized protein YbjT (DUF2867 family)
MNLKSKNNLILGATGHYGHYITRSLIRLNANIRILTRDESKARNMFGNRVDIVTGNIEDHTSLEKAFSGIDAIVYAISAMSVQQVRRFRQIEQDAVVASLQLARQMGIRRIVYISVFEIDPQIARKYHLATADEKIKVEEYLGDSDFNWTIFGAPPSMEIFFRMIRGGKMTVPGGGPKGLPTISPFDLGEIVARAVLRDDLPGLRIKLTAPQAYSFADAARRISVVWGKKIQYMKIPMILPGSVYYLSAPFCPFSDRILYVHTLLGFIRLLNNFPEKYIEEVPAYYQKLISLFSYSPGTIEDEAERRKKR